MTVKISVVTINLNNVEGLIATIESVQKQTYRNIELIIIDGVSTDGSLDFLKSIEKSINVLISEPDKGIFDAMNKGITCASGEWLCFMNSGDTFFDEFVISDIFSTSKKYKTNEQEVKLIYGIQFTDFFQQPAPVNFLRFGIMHACHQAMFFRAYEELKYREQFELYGDYDLVARIYADDPKYLEFVPRAVCSYEGGGISSKVSLRKRLEKYISVYSIFGFKQMIMSILLSILIRK